MPIQYLSNTSPTMPRVIAISGPIKPTGGLRQLPDIPPVPLGAPENCANQQGLAGAGSHASSTYAGLIRGYMDVTLSHAHNMPEALCMPDSHGHPAFGIN